MITLDQIHKLQTEIKEKNGVYHNMLSELLNQTPKNLTELFRLKRNLVNISHEKTKLIEDFKHLTLYYHYRFFVSE